MKDLSPDAAPPFVLLPQHRGQRSGQVRHRSYRIQEFFKGGGVRVIENTGR